MFFGLFSCSFIKGSIFKFFSFLISVLLNNQVYNSIDGCYFIMSWSYYINEWNSFSLMGSFSYIFADAHLILLYIITTVVILLLLWLSIIIRLVDFLIEPFIALTIIEQLSLIVGIKLLLLSELMLSFACFWCYINFRIIGCILLLFYFPLLSSYSFPIPFTNPLIPLFSSLPIQCSQIFIKIGFLNYSIEGLGQPPSAGFYSIILQCKEFSYPYFSLTDRLIGPIYYFTTGLHGFHVLLGAFLFFITLFYIMFVFELSAFGSNGSITLNTHSFNYAFYFMEFPFPLFLSSHHRHFVDFIWLMVFLLFLV